MDIYYSMLIINDKLTSHWFFASKGSVGSSYDKARHCPSRVTRLRLSPFTPHSSLSLPSFARSKSSSFTGNKKRLLNYF